MATRKTRTAFAIKRFLGFWNRYKKSRRGLVGLIIVVLFSLMAICAPILAPFAPIDPMKDQGDYPALGVMGPKIAEKLCKPIWYKYLPWIHKGQVNHEESFFSSATLELGHWHQNFTRTTGSYTDRVVRLSTGSTKLPQVEATFPNGTSRELVYQEEWTWEPRYPDTVDLQFILPAQTQIEIAYLSGEDITENMELEPDFRLSSNQTFYDEWKWIKYSNFVSVKWNGEKGWNDDGCIEISYNRKRDEPVPEKAGVVLLKHFEYPYWEPPQSFWMHLSAYVEGHLGTSADITLSFYTPNQTYQFPLIKFTKLPEPIYSHDYVISSSDPVMESVGSPHPEKAIFISRGNYTFAIEVAFNTEKENMTMYLDNLNGILYGNAFGLLGTDNGLRFPRDIYSTLIYGTQVSLFVGVLSAIFSTLIGLFLGLTAGYVGGLVDEVLMRFADLLLVLPTLPLFIVLVVALKMVYGLVSMWNIIIVLTFLGWMGFARSVRSMVLSLRERTFIEAAKASGAGKLYVISKHLLPNVFALVYITLATSVPGAIVTEASLSWLGLGDPMIASWGKLLYDFQSSGVTVTKGLTEYWFWVFPACLSIAILATAFILIGFALDEILNPRLRQRR